MQAIRFETGEVVFRPTGEHSFSVGALGVASIQEVDYVPHHTLPACREPLVKNLCGRFKTYLDECWPHGSVSHRAGGMFGRHDTMFHVHGSVSVHSGVPFFKGCQGYGSICALAEDLFLETPRCEVHMGVFKVCLGRYLSTDQGCFLENSVAQRFRCLRVCQRMAETTLAVKLRVDAFDEAEMPVLRGALAPTSVDVSVTTKGVVMVRISWSHCAWDAETEARAVEFCAWLAGALRECC